ncbi:hypothetical protein OIU76_025695, partial [Salix suchowensis]
MTLCFSTMIEQLLKLCQAQSQRSAPMLQHHDRTAKEKLTLIIWKKKQLQDEKNTLIL